MEQQKQQLSVDLKQTTAIKSEDGNQIFQEGFLLRKVSRFLTGQAKDGVIPVPVFFDIVTGLPLKDTLPPDLVNEFYPNTDAVEDNTTQAQTGTTSTSFKAMEVVK